jgi:peptidoglycan/xylan/chitin deacetylase (PgdA/CDA1 family)
MACALIVMTCVAVFGAVMSQRSAGPVAVAPPATEPTVKGPVITTIDETSSPSPGVITTGKAPDASTKQVAPIVAAAPAPAPAPAAAAAPAAATPSAPATLAQQAPVAAAPTQAPAPIPVQAAAPAPAAPVTTSSCPGNPNAIGLARTVEIDTTGGPGFGFEHFKMHDFLRDGEVVLTFDDGPWPKNTEHVLAALTAHCTKAIFFPIGLHATYEPGILKKVAAGGHAVGSHTWCHQDLSKTKGSCLVAGKRESVEYNAKDEIEKGISAVRWAVGGPTAPYFRFPALRQPPELIEYLGKRNIGIFSTDMDSFDFKMRKPEQVRQSVLSRLKKHGKGIVLMHDFQHATADAAMDLLNDLKANGYKIVFMKPKFAVTTLPEYDDIILKQVKTAGSDGRPTSSVVRTIND